MKIQISRKAVQQTVAESKARAARFSGAAVNWTKPLEGNNVFRLFAWNRGDTGEGAFVREIRVHQPPNGKPIVCGKSPARDGTSAKECEHCAEARRVEQERGRDAASRFRSRPRYAFLAVPLRLGGKVVAGEDRRVRVWQASKTVGEKILAQIVDEDIVEDPSDFFGVNGLDVKVKFDPNAKGAAMYEVSVLPPQKAKALDPEMQEQAQKADLFADASLEPEWFALTLAGAPGDDGEAEEEADEDDFDDEDEAADEAEESDDGDDLGLSDEEQEVYDATMARLKADGLDSEYDVEVVEDEDGNPAPVFYKIADGDDAEGSWDYPEVKKPKRRTRRPAAAKAAEQFKARSGPKKRRAPPADEGADDADE